MAHASSQERSLLHRRGEKGLARSRAIRWLSALAALAIALGVGSRVPAQPPGPGNGQVQGGGKPDEVLGQPKQLIDNLGPRSQALPAALKIFGQAPVPTRQDLDLYHKYIVDFQDPRFSIDLITGQARLLTFREAPFRIQVTDPAIFDYNPPGNNPAELLVQGTRVGSTTMFMWFGDRNDRANQQILAFQVNVLPDPDQKRRLEEIYRALQNEINEAFPDSVICLTLVGDKLVVSGEAKDAIEATHILSLLRPGTAGPAGGAASNPVLANRAGTNINLNLAGGGLYANLPGLQEGQVRPGLENYILPGEGNIINLMKIPGEQQVALKVTVAEVSRGASRAIGINYSFTNKEGVNFFHFGTGTTGNLPFILDNGRVLVAINALRDVNMARSLAEPNVVAINGQTATFNAGGEFPVPVVTGATATGLQGISFVPFGVQVSFTPIITCRDRIRLQLQASVSTLNGSSTVNGNVTPNLQTRSIQTVVEMREGQTFAVGGLLQSSLSGDTSRVPGLGDLPILGNLFRNNDTSAQESELILLVTPQLVRPLEPYQKPPIPGSDYFEPGDLEFYLLGRIESSRPYDYRSPVMDDINRMAAYRRCELLYFVGPHGHSDAR